MRAFALRCDVTDEASVRAMMKEVGRELGRIDILVNNAANYETAEFEKLTVRQWDAIFASNTRGPFLVSREALKWMRRKRGKGSGPIEAKIINMGSLGGLRPWATHAHYCSSKAAVHMLTKVMAKALAPEIAVNAVAPGMIDLGREGGRRLYAQDGQADAHAAQRERRRDCRGGFVLRDRAAVYYRADSRCGWRARAVARAAVRPWEGQDSVVPPFEFLRVLRGPSFASFAVDGSRSKRKSKDFDREGREDEVGRIEALANGAENSHC